MAARWTLEDVRRVEARRIGRKIGLPEALPVPTEHEEQKALMDWWRWYAPACGVDERLLMAIPNAGKRSRATGRWFKAEGLRKGAPDMLLAVPRGRWHGLFVENKRRAGGRVSEEQEDMLALLAAQGYHVTVCRGWDEARATIQQYMEAEG